jgi:hypothetical protein
VISAASLSAGSVIAQTTLVKQRHPRQSRTHQRPAHRHRRREIEPELTALSYGETITAGATTIKASHVTELRNGVK